MTTTEQPRTWATWHQETISGRRRGLGAALTRLGLSAISMPYGLVTRTRNALYDRRWLHVEEMPVPVVSIGNLTLGGTGKTPAVEYVARFFREHEVLACILSRGYGSQGGRNDEALVLEQNLPDVPHLQGKDRIALARTALEELESEVLILDDGFQHRRLHRNLDVVLLDATQPWAHDRLFPRGTLREAKRGLRRAHAIVLTRCDQVPAEAVVKLHEEIKRSVPGVPVIHSKHVATELVNTAGETQDVTTLRDQLVAGFCGIGNPMGFKTTLERLGARVQDWRTYKDHQAYSEADQRDLRQWGREQPPDAWLMTTQKDLVKLHVPQLGGRPLWAVRIALEPTTGKEVLDDLLKGVIA